MYRHLILHTPFPVLRYKPNSIEKRNINKRPGPTITSTPPPPSWKIKAEKEAAATALCKKTKNKQKTNERTKKRQERNEKPCTRYIYYAKIEIEHHSLCHGKDSTPMSTVPTAVQPEPPAKAVHGPRGMQPTTRKPYTQRHSPPPGNPGQTTPNTPPSPLPDLSALDEPRFDCLRPPPDLRVRSGQNQKRAQDFLLYNGRTQNLQPNKNIVRARARESICI